VPTADFRAGVIWASQGRFPTSYQCVDVAVLDKQRGPGLGKPYAATKILLGKKKTDKLLRFFGGFVDPADPDLETCARREVKEEAGVEVAGVKYVGSANVPDWRYRGEPDCIKTALFTAVYQHGRPEPLDDLEGGEVRWVRFDELKQTDIVPQHRHLYDLLIEKGL
jgi:bifunctional NMN adenylyltransferase/nudix hydrolase